MKKYLFLLVTILVLGSCSHSQNNKVLGDQEKLGKTVSVLGQQVPQSYFEDSEFLSCTQSSVDECIMKMNYRSNNQDIAWCDTLLLSSNIESCKENILIMKARDIGDATICDALEDAGSCKYEVLVLKGLSEKNIEICKEVEKERSIECINYLAYNIAQQTLNEELCILIIPRDEKDRDNEVQKACYDDVNFGKEEQKNREQQE